MAKWNLTKKEREKLPSEEEANEMMAKARKRTRRTFAGNDAERKPLVSYHGDCPYCKGELKNDVLKAFDGCTLEYGTVTTMGLDGKPHKFFDHSMGVKPVDLVCPHCDTMIKIKIDISFTAVEVLWGEPPPANLRWFAGHYIEAKPEETKKPKRKNKRKKE